MTKAEFVFNKKDNLYFCVGNWTILRLDDLKEQIGTISWPKNQSVVISGEQLTQLDSAGALTLSDYVVELTKRGNEVKLVDFNPQQTQLLDIINDKKGLLAYEPPAEKQHNVIYLIGKQSVHKFDQLTGFITLVGDLSDKIARAFIQWRRFQGPAILSNIGSAGVQALPIIGLLSFLIGVVLAYQMGLQLETYGANIYIAYLSGMAIFREFAPLITAILVAGRTGSAFTAQIGSMKVNEEIDALYTMGLSPIELLVVPKVIGLLIALPLLVFWSNATGILGAMLMSKAMLNVGYGEFLLRLQDSVGFKHMALGLYKAPAFALLIALVGCFQGLRVEANADSVGSQTTKSVVQALFLIIITDAVYSVIYNVQGL